MQDAFNNIEATLGPLWPILVFVLILLVGYVVAKVVEGVVRAALRRTRLDDKLLGAVSDNPNLSSERIGGRIAFWVVIVIALIAAFNAVDLGAVGGPLGEFVGTIIAFIPRLIGAVILGIVAYAVGKILEALTTKALQAVDLDERVNAASGGDMAAARSSAGAVPMADVNEGSHPVGEVGPGAQADLDAATGPRARRPRRRLGAGR